MIITVETMLKYANLQMAAESTGLNESIEGKALIDALEIGNERTTRSAAVIAQAFGNAWTVAAHQINTETGFSGTLFRNRQSGELVLSFRSTEFIDDAARDNQATNDLEIRKLGWAFGQIADMQAWYGELLSSGKIPAGSPLVVTGYSLGGHLASAFAQLYPAQVAAAYTFNGAGIGMLREGNSLQEVMEAFAIRRSVGSSDLFTEDGAADLYRSLSLQFSKGSINTAASIRTRLAEIDFALDQTPMSNRRDEMLVLRNALSRMNDVAHEAERAAGLPSGNGGASAARIGTDLIEATSLDYQLAVIKAGERTQSYGDPDAVGKATGLLARTSDGWANVFDIYGDTNPSLVANSQRHLGMGVPVWIEDQPESRGNIKQEVLEAKLATGEYKLLASNFALNDFGDTHSLVLLIDSLSVQNVLSTLDPTLGEQRLSALFNAASNARVQTGFTTDVGPNNQGKADGTTLDNVVNSLGLLLGQPWAINNPLRGNTAGGTWAAMGDDTNGTTGRDTFYERLKDIQGSDAFRALAGNVVIRPLEGSTAGNLATQARARVDFQTFVALQTLSPFLIDAAGQEGAAALESLWQTPTWQSLHDAWLQDKILLTQGFAATNFTDSYLTDRAQLLQALLVRNTQNKDSGPVFHAAAPDGQSTVFHYDDPAAVEYDARLITQRPGGSSTSPDRHIFFGNDQANTLTGSKSPLGDHLYAGSGDDTLNGGLGDDWLEGGLGEDRYDFNGAWGRDWVVDLDGLGNICIDGFALASFRGTVVDSAYACDLGPNQFAGLAVTADATSSTGWRATIVQGTNTGNSITIQNFDLARARGAEGYLGIRIESGPSLLLLDAGNPAAAEGNPFRQASFKPSEVDVRTGLREGGGRGFTVDEAIPTVPAMTMRLGGTELIQRPQTLQCRPQVRPIGNPSWAAC